MEKNHKLNTKSYKMQGKEDWVIEFEIVFYNLFWMKVADKRKTFRIKS